MAKRADARMRVLVASDGSSSSHAALVLALSFPWPEGARARGVVSLGRAGWAGTQFRAAMIRALHASAEQLDRDLGRRWPEAQVFALHDSPAAAICSEARRFRADAIVLGWRGHGAFARLLAGSVSRAVAERARCSVLIVRRRAQGRPAAPRRFAVGFDGSANSRKAIRLLARLAPPENNRVVLVSVLEPLVTPSLSRAGAGLRAEVRQAVARRKALLQRRARKRGETAADFLRRRGWHVATHTRWGAPLDGLLIEAQSWQAEALVVGARGASGMTRVLLGSVASGALDRSPIPVFIAR